MLASRAEAFTCILPKTGSVIFEALVKNVGNMCVFPTVSFWLSSFYYVYIVHYIYFTFLLYQGSFSAGDRIIESVRCQSGKTIVKTGCSSASVSHWMLVKPAVESNIDWRSKIIPVNFGLVNIVAELHRWVRTTRGQCCAGQKQIMQLRLLLPAFLLHSLKSLLCFNWTGVLSVQAGLCQWQGASGGANWKIPANGPAQAPDPLCNQWKCGDAEEAVIDLKFTA